MARVYIHVTHGSENPTRAGLAWLMAKGAIEAGHSPEVTLAGDGAILANRTAAENVFPVGIPPLKELIAFAMEHKVPVYV